MAGPAVGGGGEREREVVTPPGQDLGLVGEQEGESGEGGHHTQK